MNTYLKQKNDTDYLYDLFFVFGVLAKLKPDCAINFAHSATSNGNNTHTRFSMTQRAYNLGAQYRAVVVLWPARACARQTRTAAAGRL